MVYNVCIYTGIVYFSNIFENKLAEDILRKKTFRNNNKTTNLYQIVKRRICKERSILLSKIGKIKEICSLCLRIIRLNLLLYQIEIQPSIFDHYEQADQMVSYYFTLKTNNFLSVVRYLYLACLFPTISKLNYYCKSTEFRRKKSHFLKKKCWKESWLQDVQSQLKMKKPGKFVTCVQMK